ncbi:hypothetical protein [Paraburkholderia sp. JPY419]|uniref:hypothetical protein n=1 Tax=Paraburkholderia sp. JPY419 TaxID=667660 RepID=UPI003D2423BD
MYTELMLQALDMALRAVEANVDCAIADGAYYSADRGVLNLWRAAGDSATGHAAVHNQPATRWHDHLARYIKDKGIHALHNR